MRSALGVSIALALVACEGSRGAKPPAELATPPAATSAPAPTTSVSETVPDPITHPCVVAAAQYTNALRAGSDECNADGDCACYQGGIGGASGCGGVLNRESVAKLDEIGKRFRDMKCPHTQLCAAWACQPRCAQGHCKG